MARSRSARTQPGERAKMGAWGYAVGLALSRPGDPPPRHPAGRPGVLSALMPGARRVPGGAVASSSAGLGVVVVVEPPFPVLPHPVLERRLRGPAEHAQRLGARDLTSGVVAGP